MGRHWNVKAVENVQYSLFPSEAEAPLRVQTADSAKNRGSWLEMYLAAAQLDGKASEYENWEIHESSAKLSYLTHGIFRYFGKFPPPVARRFIEELHDPTVGPMIDPMVGSGTSLVEAALLNRSALAFDVNPLAVLVSRVKTTPVARPAVTKALEDLYTFWGDPAGENWEQLVPVDKQLDHWFFPETVRALAKTRLFIETRIDDDRVKDLFLVGLASIIRRVSRASNGMGRMFFDPAVTPQDVHELLSKKIVQIARATEGLGLLFPEIDVQQQDARQPFYRPEGTNLVICHPPYFNLYRYSSIYKYEMLWLGFDYRASKKGEVREGFKLGKAHLVHDYVADLLSVLQNIESVLVPGGWCVLMMGDTFMHEQRINTTYLTLQALSEADAHLRVDRIIIRHPKYTEASYAAAQRRTKEEVGVKLPDHLVILRKVTQRG